MGMRVEPVLYGLTWLTPVRLVSISLAFCVFGALLGAYQRALQRI